MNVRRKTFLWLGALVPFCSVLFIALPAQAAVSPPMAATPLSLHTWPSALIPCVSRSKDLTEPQSFCLLFSFCPQKVKAHF